MQVTCKNCEHTYHGKYCSECGQKAKTQRLDWHYLADEAKYTFLHFNGGLTFTLKQLFTRPGDSVREFIEGKRVHHYKPVLLLFVLAGIYGLMMHYIDLNAYMSQPSSDIPDRVKDIQKAIFQWTTNHYSIVELVQLPFFSLCSWLAFRKYGYNFIEHIIVNTFAASQRLVLNILAAPILIWLGKSPLVMVLSLLVGFGSFALTIWTFVTFFRGRDLGMVILRLLLFAFLCLILFLVFITAAIAVMVTFFDPKKLFGI